MVLFHHERWDGSGYPLKLKAEAIGNFASIVAVCDVYDALTTERSYKKALTVNDALLYIMRNTLIHFNPYVSQRFVNEMTKMYDLGSFYPVGAFVLLNTGEVGCITAKEQEYAMRPQVIILERKAGEPLRNPIQADLKLDLSRTIVKTVDNPERIEMLSLLV
jgi:HD-GYP domain-containing protein (c-di-GMP phosphodiesterase class II)